MNDIEQKLLYIKNWLGTGSINIFGLPMSGKDTVGVRFAELMSGKFLSSGLIIRAVEKETHRDITSSGALAPSNVFYDIVLPYFSREDLRNFPLILSSVGRWSGEETEVMNAASAAGHEIKAVVLLELSEKDVIDRRDAAILLGDRGERADDNDSAVFERRIMEFREKTIPVIEHYESLGKLIRVRADQSRDAVFVDFVNSLYEFAKSN